MNINVLRALVAPLLLVAAAAWSQTNAQAEAEQKAAVEAAEKSKTDGPAEIPLRDQARLKLPAGYTWVPQAAAAQLLRSMGNRTDERLIGVVFPQNDAGWFAVVQYVNEGYVKDDDARDWNADDLMKSLREGTDAGNEERAKRGIPGIEVVGWAEKPHYEAASHQLVWSATTREKGSNSDPRGVNYNTYTLGREGYISLNLVTGYKDLPAHKPAALELLAATQYNEGKRYADFSSSTDKVAAYGLAALVAGAAAKKLGFFALALAFFAKFAKVIVVAIGGAAWGFAKMFGRKEKAPAPVEPVLATAPAALGDTPKPPGAA